MSNRVAVSLCLSAVLSTAAAAQDLPKTQVKVIGLNSPTPVSIYDELPFWRKTISEASKGAITADITPLDQMGAGAPVSSMFVVSLASPSVAPARRSVSTARRNARRRRAATTRSG
jgi:hypothetical protein